MVRSSGTETQDVVVIANDVNFQSGSFATETVEVFQLASEYIRQWKIPCIYVSCYSGARIGLDENVSKIFRAKFTNPENPLEGLDYLYVDGDDEALIKDQICYEKLPNGILKLTGFIGLKVELVGVENLQALGLIAGETSAAYNEVPTYCLVTGRYVVIGAYTARLAHQIVQANNSHLILTGAPALNTLLGKEVYTSNNQLGRIQIMHKDGVTHSVVNDDFESICSQIGPTTFHLLRLICLTCVLFLLPFSCHCFKQYCRDYFYRRMKMDSLKKQQLKYYGLGGEQKFSLPGLHLKTASSNTKMKNIKPWDHSVV